MKGCFPPSISWNQSYVKDCNLTPSNGCENVNSHNFFELDNFPYNVHIIIPRMLQGIMKITFEVPLKFNLKLSSWVAMLLKSHRSCDFDCQWMFK